MRIIGQRLKIAPQDSQGGTLKMDSALSSDASPAEKRERGTPALEGVLEDKGGDDDGERKPARPE